MRRRLLLTIGDRERYLELEVGKDCLVGRQLDATFFLNHTSVSRRHCVLRATPTGIEIEDVTGRNASFFNGQKLLTRTLLHNDGVLQLGSLAFRVQILDEDVPILCSRCSMVVAPEELTGSPDGKPLCQSCSNNYAATNEHELEALIDAQGYVVQQSLGGLPATFAVERRGVGRPYVVKAIELSRVPRDRVDKLREEARALASLEHPAVATIHDAIETKGVLLVVLAKVAGMPLDAHVVQHGPLALADALRVVRTLAEAVVYMNAKGIVHREVTPGNVLVSTDGVNGIQARLTNFPLTRDIAELSRSFTGGGGLQRLTFVAPEVIADPSATAPLSDVFGLGAVLVGALTGASPYGRVNPSKHVSDVIQRVPLTLALDQVPSSLRELLAQLLDTSPQRRPQTPDAALALIAAAEKSLQRDGREFRGTFASDELIEYVQLLALNSKTGQLEIQAGEVAGKLWIVNGVVEWGIAKGERDPAAVPRKLLRLRNGQFRFVPDSTPPPTPARLRLAANALLLDIMRERDEQELPS